MYEIFIGGKMVNEIDFEEVVKKKCFLGWFMFDGLWDDEDLEGRV